MTTQKACSRTNRRAAGVAPVGVLVVFMGVAGWAAPVRAQEAGSTRETWYLYRIGGKDFGHLRQTVRRTGAEVKTTQESLLVVSRPGATIEINSQTDYVESADGKLRSLNWSMSSSVEKMTVAATVAPGKVLLRVSTGGKEYRRELPFSGELLGPSGIDRAMARGLKSVGDVVTCQKIMPDLQRVSKLTLKLLEANASLDLAGKKTACRRVARTVEGYPTLEMTWIDREERTLRQTAKIPSLGETELVMAERGAALRAVGGRASSEMYAWAQLRGNVRLPGPRSLERLVLRLRQRDASVGWPDFAGAGQSVLRRGDRDLVLEVRQLPSVESGSRPVPADKSLREFLAPNALLQSDDAAVERIAREVVGNEKEAFRAACRLRDWVKDNMQMGPGIVFAPASETIRERTGTVAAYAIVLASLARAAGIPSQVVMGLAYESGMWRQHAWVEVWTGNRWVPLDGALPSPGPADAARIACVRTSFAAGPGPLLSALLRVNGNFEVRILEFASGGATVKVPEGAAAFTVEGNTYRNPGLGLKVQKPADFRFAQTNAAFPDATVVAIVDPAGERVSLEQHPLPEGAGDEPMRRVFERLDLFGKLQHETIAGRPTFVVDDETIAGLAFTVGGDLWVLIAEGEHAGERVRKAAAMVTFGRAAL